MSARRKIAGWLRAVAYRIDDAPRLSRETIEARYQAVAAIPRRVNRYVARSCFRRGAEANPLAVAEASRLEARSPGLYAGNEAMIAAIETLRHRTSGGQHV